MKLQRAKQLFHPNRLLFIDVKRLLDDPEGANGEQWQAILAKADQTPLETPAEFKARSGEEADLLALAAAENQDYIETAVKRVVGE